LILMDAVGKANKYLTDQEPWKMKNQPERQRAVVHTVLECCYYFAHVLLPICPIAAKEMFTQLMAPEKTLRELSSGFNNLIPGASIGIAKNLPVLFSKFEQKKEQRESLADAKAKKKQKQQQNANSSQGKSKKGAAADPNQDMFTKVLLKVGVIEDIKEHADADKLYIETINLGEEKGARQIVSGLKLHYPDMLALKGRKVIVVANMKKANLVGVASTGMVLCGVDKETGATELVDPPADAEIGEIVFVDGFNGTPLSESQEKKKKAWRKLQPQLGTNDKRVCVWEDKALMCKSGPCTVASLTGAMLK